MIKHYYGEYGLTLYSDIAILLSVTIVLADRVLSPFHYNSLPLIIPDVTALYLVLVSKNLTVSLGQDLSEGTVITFLQMRGRRSVFTTFIIVNVVLPYLVFVLSSLLIFFLSNFPFSFIYTDFTSYYLFSTGGNLFITLILKKSLRSFLVGNLFNVSVIFLSLVNYHVIIATFFGLIFYAMSYFSFLLMQL